MYDYQDALLKGWLLHWGSFCRKLKIISVFQIMQPNAMVETKIRMYL